MAVTGASIDAGSPASASRHAVRLSRSLGDHPSSSNLWSSLGGWDTFMLGEDNWIVRPPAAKLKLVLEALSPGLDGWPLQRLIVLADELIACGNQEDPMVRVCLEMRELLQDVFRALAQELNPCGNQEKRSIRIVGVGVKMRGPVKKAFEGLVEEAVEGLVEEAFEGLVEEAFEGLADQLIAYGNEEEGVCQQMLLLESWFEVLQIEKHPVNSKLNLIFWGNVSLELAKAMTHRSCTVIKLGWAVTWVETLLLEHDMLQVRSSEITVMQAIRDRWNKLDLCWPPKLEQTRDALDFHRRSALLSCGQEREAVQNLEAPGFWLGFEASFLYCGTSGLYFDVLRMPGRLSYGYGWRQLRDKRACCLERAANAGPKDHEHWPLIRQDALWKQVHGFRGVDRKRSDQAMGTALAEFGQIDLHLRFDFPVPLPEIQLLKLKLLINLAVHRATGWQPHELVPGIGPEVLDTGDVVQSSDQARYAYACLVLRGMQLIDSDRVQEGLQTFRPCLAKAGSLAVFSDHSFRFFHKTILIFCRRRIQRDVADKGIHPDRANRIHAFCVEHGGDYDGVLVYKLLARNSPADSRVWSSYAADSTSSLQQGSQLAAGSASKGRVGEAFWKLYKHSCAAFSEANAVECRYEARQTGTGEKVQRLAGSEMPSFFLFHFHALAATVSRIFPFNAEAPHGGEIARQALLSVETARNYRHEGFGPQINWERIQRAHRACGTGAVFVLFAGLAVTPPQYGQSLGEWPGPCDDVHSCVLIVVQDEGVASCHTLDGVHSEDVQESVRNISNACRERKLESDSCRNALETLYDLLIRPLFHEFIHQGKGKEWKRHRKLVISAVGSCKDVPFSILRNKDSGCYLFQEAQLAVTPTFLMLDNCQLRYEELQKRSLLAGAGAAVALGDPLYLPYEAFTPLPGSRKEVDAICQLFHFCHPDHEIVKLLGCDATVERVLEWAKKPSTGVASGTGQCSQAFIHMAAHGSGGQENDHGTLRLASAATAQTRRRRRAAKGNVARDERAHASSSDEESHEAPEAADSSDMPAALFGHRMLEQLEAFEPDSAAEGSDFLPRLLRSLRNSDPGTSLQCDDILLSGSEWSAYMVVLSACNTSVGVALDANVLDVLSFTRAFITAGVPCSVLAQWTVDDSAATHLMRLFYEALTQGEDACSALQSAMIEMHQTENYTLHQLAPFVVTGLPTVRLPLQMRRCPA